MSTYFFVALQNKAAAGGAVTKVTAGGSEASITKAKEGEQPPIPATSQLASDDAMAVGSGPQAPVEEVAVMKVSTDLVSAPPPSSNTQVLRT